MVCDSNCFLQSSRRTAVLILVVVEDGLRLEGQVWHVEPVYVLILVVVEDGLRLQPQLKINLFLCMS